MNLNNPLNQQTAIKKEENIDADITSSDKQSLLRIINENCNVDEIKFQCKDNKIKRIIAKENIAAPENVHVERMCRQYPNQDVLIKIRNGKKLLIERTRITNL